MKRLFVILVLLAMMLGLGALGVDTGVSGSPLTLAAIGFVVLASFAVAELLGQFKLPRVTGYILTGIVLGPYVANVLSDTVVEEMRMFNELAVGLIALTAGIELELASLKRQAKSLAATIGLKVVPGALMVGGTLIAVEMMFHPLGLEDQQLIIPIALVLAALSIGTSPAISLAIITETRSKGPLADLVIGAAVAKDLVVVIAVALAVGVDAVLLSPGASLDASVLGHLAVELGVSVVGGLVLGVLLIAYLRFVKAEMLLFVTAVVLLVSEAGHAVHDAFHIHVELLLLFIVAGFCVRNFSKYQHDLLHPLETVSLPIFVVFFTNAGASINLTATLAVLPVALLLFFVRGAGFFLAGNLGAKWGGEQDEVRKNAWMSYLAQAGVALGLLDLAASNEALSAVSEPLLTLGMAVIALNLLAGPITLRIGLTRAGEPEAVRNKVSTEEGETEETSMFDQDVEVTKEVADEVARIRRSVQNGFEIRLERAGAAWLVGRRGLRLDDPDKLEHAGDKIPKGDASELAEKLIEVHGQLCGRLRELDETWVPETEEDWARPPTPEDGEPVEERLLVSLRRFRWRVRRALGVGRPRRIPLALASREAYESRAAALCLELLRASQRADAAIADAVRRMALGELDGPAAAAFATTAVSDFKARLRGAGRELDESAGQRFADLVARLDSPVLPRQALDLAEPIESSRQDLKSIETEAAAWDRVSHAAWTTVSVTRRLCRLGDGIEAAFNKAEALFSAPGTLDETLNNFGRRLGEMKQVVEDAEALDEATFENLATRCTGLMPKPAIKSLRAIETRGRAVHVGQLVERALRDGFADAQGSENELIDVAGLVRADAPARAVPTRVEVRTLADSELIGRFAPLSERLVGEIVDRVVATGRTAGERVGDAELLIDVASKDDDPGRAKNSLLEGFSRLLDQLEELRTDSVGELRQKTGELQTAIVEVERALHGELLAQVVADSGRAQARRARAEVERRVVAVAKAAFGWVRERVTAAWEVVRRVSRDYELESTPQVPSALEVARNVETALKSSSLSAGYAPLFEERPVRDPRFFTVHRDVLRRAEAAEREWRRSKRGNAMLIIGEAGAGKTSLLNVARLKLRTREVVELADPKRRSVVDALMAALHVETDEGLREALAEFPRAVVVDDLEHHLPLGAAAVDELERLLRLIVDSEGHTFWLVAMGAEARSFLGDVSQLRLGFADEVRLPRLGPADVGALLLSRHRVSGKEVEYPDIGVQSALRRAGLLRFRSTPEDEFFAALSRSCRGIPRHAIAHWRKLVEEHADGHLVMGSPLASERVLPFISGLPVETVAVMSTLLRFGPRTREELRQALHLDTAAVDRAVAFLATARLANRDGEQLGCPAELEEDVARELRRMGVFSE